MESTKTKKEMSFIHSQHNYVIDRVLWGLVIIVAGIVLLLTGNNTIDTAWKEIFFSWHMLVIIFGLQALFHKHFFFGMVLIAVSLLVDPHFYVQALNMNAYDTEYLIFIQRQVLYVAIILFGAWIIVRSFFRKRIFCCNNRHRRHINNEDNHDFSTKFGEMNMDSDKNGKIDYQFTFSGSEQVFLEPIFRGGTIKTTFGGLTLDLRKSILDEENTILDIDATFGGVVLILPKDWYVDINSQCLCGGFDDKRLNMSAQDHSKCLTINVKCLFGGGEIK